MMSKETMIAQTWRTCNQPQGCLPKCVTVDLWGLYNSLLGDFPMLIFRYDRLVHTLSRDPRAT